MKSVKRFIRDVHKRIEEWRSILLNEYRLLERLQWLFIETIDVLITGSLLLIAIEFTKSDYAALRIISYGLISALAVYYLRLFVSIVRGKEPVKIQ